MDGFSTYLEGELEGFFMTGLGVGKAVIPFTTAPIAPQGRA